MKMRIICAVLIALTTFACQDQSAKRDSNIIKQNIKEVREEQEQQQSPKVSKKAIDAACEGVTDARIAEVEGKMMELRRKNAIMSGEDLRVLRCSRLRKRLRQ